MPGASAEARRTVVVRLPASGWPGPHLADLLGDDFLVTGTAEIVADVVIVDGGDASEVRELRRIQPAIGIVVHTDDAHLLSMLDAGADVAVTSAVAAEVAARLRAIVRRLPSG